MRGASTEIQAFGLTTNVPLHRALMREPGFVAGGSDIHHLERLIAAGHFVWRDGRDAG